MTGVGTGGMNLLPWIVGGVVVGGIGAAGGGGSDHSGGATVDLPPTVDVSYDPTTGNFTIDFSEVPYNPKTGKPFTADEIKDLITKDLSNNLNPDNIIVTVDPNDNTKFIVTGSPTDSLKDVTVDIPADSYEGKSGNLGGGDQATADVIPPQVTVAIDPEGNITITYPDDVDPDTIDKDKITITDKAGNPIEVELTPSDDGLTFTGKVPADTEGKVTVDVPAGSYQDTSGNSGLVGNGEGPVDTTPPQVTIKLEESELVNPILTIKFTEIPCDVNGVALTPEQVKALLSTQGFDFDSGLTTKDGGLTWTAPITYTAGDAKASIIDGSYFDAVKNSGGGATDSLIAPEVISVEPTESLVVTGGNMGGSKFESGNITSNGSDASKFNKHELNVDLGTGSDNARIIINLDKVDNAFTLMVNGVDLIKSTNGNKAVFQMENTDKTHGTNQILLKYYNDKGALVEFGEAAPWSANVNGLPRIQVVITEDGIRLFGALSTTSTELVELYISDQDMSRLNLPDLKNGVNTITVINPDSSNADAIKGNMSALSGAGFTISDDDSTEVSKAVIKVAGDLNGTIITPVLPEGMKAVWNADHSELTLIAINGALSHQDFTDAINLLMFGVKGSATVTAGERKIEITVYDEDGLKSDTTTGVFDYQSGMGNIYVNQFDFSDAVVTSISDTFVNKDNHTVDDTGGVIFNLLSDDNLGGNTEVTVTDFKLGSTQHIDVSALLSASANATNIGEYLSVQYDADKDQAVISIDRDGAAIDYQAADLLILSHQKIDITLDELLKNNQIII